MLFTRSNSIPLSGGKAVDESAARGLDPRPVFVCLLGAYLLLGWWLWGINRSPLQGFTTIGVATLADLLCNRYLRRRGWAIPWSGMITGIGLCLLLNMGANPWLPILPALLAILSKSLFTVRGKHAWNPGLFGLIVGMWISGGLLSPAPAYQWGGTAALLFVAFALALVWFFPGLKARGLVGWFLGFYLVQAALRAHLMQHHVPAEAIFLGSITSPAFFLFTFYMLTDPATTPRTPRGQMLFALAVVVVDLLLHFKQSYSTLFPALFLVQGVIFAVRLVKGFSFTDQLPRFATAGALALLCAATLRSGDPADAPTPVRFTAAELMPAGSDLDGSLSDVLDTLDPRVRHIGKWIFSVGDSVAVADVDGDGWQDVFLNYPLKQADQRCLLLRNLEGKGFERIPLPALDRFADPQKHGLPGAPVFADIDGDGDSDLFLGVGYGESRLLENQHAQLGRVEFVDITERSGIAGHSVCLTACFFDADGDGDLDLLEGQALRPYLADYDTPTPLNPFALPEPEYEGDRRALHFMHASWWKAENGGENRLYRNLGGGRFERVPASESGMPETHWTLAASAADFDGDGRLDLYLATDFGPDDCYRNLGDCRFERVSGKVAGSLGRDTYKGMNTSLTDVNRDGEADIYISNVHAPLQAEGSMLWVNRSASGHIDFRNEATRRGALNPYRFGWGAAIGDLDLDGRPDIVQCNGMVDDTMDRRFDTPRDYWYAHARLARTGPEIHAYADQWGDMRGYSIWGQQRTRVLLGQTNGTFVDAAETVGLGVLDNRRGVAMFDADNDGDLDLIQTRQFAPAAFYHNQLQPADSDWISLSLEGDPTGARVRLDDGQCQWVQSMSGFSAQSGSRLHFAGQGQAEVELQIDWPSGVGSTRHRLATGRHHTVAAPAQSAVPKSASIGTRAP